MDIIIQSLGFTAGENLEGFIREKLNSLKGGHIVSATVTLFKGPAANPDADYCEIRLAIPGNDPFVKRHSAYFETSVSECVDVLQKMLVSKKQAAKRQADKTAIQDAIAEAEDDIDDDVELEDVVR